MFYLAVNTTYFYLRLYGSIMTHGKRPLIQQGRKRAPVTPQATVSNEQHSVFYMSSSTHRAVHTMSCVTTVVGHWTDLGLTVHQMAVTPRVPHTPLGSSHTFGLLVHLWAPRTHLGSSHTFGLLIHFYDHCTLLGSSYTFGLLIYLWAPHTLLGSSYTFGLLIHFWAPHTPLGSSYTFGLLIHFWAPHTPLGSSYTFGLLIHLWATCAPSPMNVHLKD